MSLYNEQQYETILAVKKHFDALPSAKLAELKEMIGDYLEFRKGTASFQERLLSGICTERCFARGMSGCCGREGILVFFADVVINALVSTAGEFDSLLAALEEDRGGASCVYLREQGCVWNMKPIACEMFLCDPVKDFLTVEEGDAMQEWEALRKEEHRFTRPTVPVLFDDIEKLFMEAGFESSLMYFHQSPGLLRLKKKHGLP